MDVPENAAGPVSNHVQIMQNHNQAHAGRHGHRPLRARRAETLVTPLIIGAALQNPPPHLHRRQKEQARAAALVAQGASAWSQDQIGQARVHVAHRPRCAQQGPSDLRGVVREGVVSLPSAHSD